MCEHKWALVSDVVELNLVNCKGEVGPIDMFPVFREVPGDIGTVCYKCFQLFGETPGVLLEDLVLFEQKMKNLSVQYSQNHN